MTAIAYGSADKLPLAGGTLTGPLILSSGAPLTANGAATFNGAFSLAATIRPTGNGFTRHWNVLAFGAKGDGSTDDAAVINAVHAAASPGDVVYYPNAPGGSYAIGAPIAPTVAGVKMLGDKASVAYSAGGANQTVIEAKAGFTGAAMVVVNGVVDFEVENLTIHGPNLTGTQMGIQFTGAASSNSAKLRSVLVSRTAGDGILADNSVKWISMYDVGVYHAGVSTGTGYGFNIQCSDSWFDNCLAAGCATAGWSVQANNITFTACRAEDSPAGYGFYVHDKSMFGGTKFIGCSTDLNGGEGFYALNLTGNGALKINGCSFRRDGNNAGAGSTTLAGVHVKGCTIPVVLDGTDVTARQGDSGGADAPHWGVNVETSSYVSINGGYLSSDATGAATHWDSAGRFVLGPNIVTATVTSGTPTYSYNNPWSTSDGSRFSQSTGADSGILQQTSTAGTSTNPLIRQIHSAGAGGRGYATQVAGDTSDRWLLTVDGTQAWGPGNASRDTFLQRAAAGVLATTKTLLVGSGTALGDNGVGELALANAATTPTTNPSGGALLYATGGQLAARNPQGLAGRVETAQLGATAAITVTASTVSTTETALSTALTIPAADPIAGATYRIVAWGYVTTSGTPPTITLRARIGGVGGTAIASSGALAPTASLSSAGFWKIECVATCWTTGASGTWSGVLSLLDAFSSVVSAADDVAAATPTVVRDTTASSDLLFTATWSANTAGNSITCAGSYAERIA